MTTNRRFRLNALVLALVLSLTSGYALFAQGAGGGLSGANVSNEAEGAAPADAGPAPAVGQSPANVDAACTGGTAPAVEGVTLSLCYQRDFTVGGNNRSSASGIPRIQRPTRWMTSITSTA